MLMEATECPWEVSLTGCFALLCSTLNIHSWHLQLSPHCCSSPQKLSLSVKRCLWTERHRKYWVTWSDTMHGCAQGHNLPLPFLPPHPHSADTSPSLTHTPSPGTGSGVHDCVLSCHWTATREICLASNQHSSIQQIIWLWHDSSLHPGYIFLSNPFHWGYIRIWKVWIIQPLHCFELLIMIGLNSLFWAFRNP